MNQVVESAVGKVVIAIVSCLVACGAHCGTLRNDLAGAWATIRYVVRGQIPEAELAKYSFSPADFSFATTGVVYEVAFAPQHAQPYDIVVNYPKTEFFKWSKAADSVRGCLVKVTVEHDGNICEESTCPMGQPYCCYASAHSCSVRHVIRTIHPCNFDWPYSDVFKVRVELQTPVPKDSYLRHVRGLLVAREEVPLR